MKTIIFTLLILTSKMVLAQSANLEIYSAVKNQSLHMLQSGSVLTLQQDLILPKGTFFIYFNSSKYIATQYSDETIRDQQKPYCVIVGAGSSEELLKILKGYKFKVESAQVDDVNFFGGTADGSVTSLSLAGHSDNFEMRCAKFDTAKRDYRELSIGEFVNVINGMFKIQFPNEKLVGPN